MCEESVSNGAALFFQCDDSTRSIDAGGVLCCGALDTEDDANGSGHMSCIGIA